MFKKSSLYICKLHNTSNYVGIIYRNDINMCKWQFGLLAISFRGTYFQMLFVLQCYYNKEVCVLIKGTVAWDFRALVFSLNDRSKDMNKLQIYHFPIFGEFAELLANSTLLAAYWNAASKFCFFLAAQFFSFVSIYLQGTVSQDFGVLDFSPKKFFWPQ